MLARKSCAQSDNATRWVVLSPYCTIAVVDRTQPYILQYSPTSCCPRIKYCWARTTRMNFLWYSTRCTDYITIREFNTVPHSLRFTNSSSQAPNQSNIIGLLANVGQHAYIYIQYVYMLHIFIYIIYFESFLATHLARLMTSWISERLLQIVEPVVWYLAKPQSIACKGLFGRATKRGDWHFANPKKAG